jgi:TolB protein
MRFKHSLLSLLLFPLFLLAEEVDEIKVHLATSENLSPIYIGKIEMEGKAFSSDYLEELSQVFLFDFAHNGFTKPIPFDEQKERVLRLKNNTEAFHAATWKNFGIPYVMKLQIEDDLLSVAVFSTQDSILKHFKNISLTGSLYKDRRQVHKIADAAQLALFNVQGIASQKILYSHGAMQTRETEWKAEIWECDWDGKNARQVTRENSYCLSPVLVPSHPEYKNDQFLYVSYKLSQPKIYIASLKEGIGKRLIDLRGNQLLPAISAQRDKIAFICDAGGRADLFLQKFDPLTQRVEKPIQLYAYPRATQASPTFSPDGTKLAFVSDKDGMPRIYTISTRSERRRATPLLLTKQTKESTCPAWSPDGKKIAYSAKINGTRQIWIYDFETDEEKQLTTGNINKENPAWAPDNLHLVFNSADANSFDLYLINLNQPETIKITSGPGKKHYPCWSTR